MPVPVYAILGTADRDESQEAIELNVVGSDGRHVDLGGGQSDPGDGSITAAKLAASAVETEKIKDAVVTEAKIADGAVTDDKIIISACAERTNARTYWCPCGRVGSSPRVRSGPGIRVDGLTGRRIISACAERTSRSSPVSSP